MQTVPGDSHTRTAGSSCQSPATDSSTGESSQIKTLILFRLSFDATVT